MPAYGCGSSAVAGSAHTFAEERQDRRCRLDAGGKSSCRARSASQPARCSLVGQPWARLYFWTVVVEMPVEAATSRTLPPALRASATASANWCCASDLSARGHDPLHVWLRHDSPGLRRHARILSTGAVAMPRLRQFVNKTGLICPLVGCAYLDDSDASEVVGSATMYLDEHVYFL